MTGRKYATQKRGERTGCKLKAPNVREDASTYFIQNCVTKRIKIGRAKDPIRRLANLQTASDCRLRILFVIEGVDCEQRLHERFSKGGVGGEWFNPIPAIWSLLYFLRDPQRKQDGLDVFSWLSCKNAGTNKPLPTRKKHYKIS